MQRDAYRKKQKKKKYVRSVKQQRAERAGPSVPRDSRMEGSRGTPGMYGSIVLLTRRKLGKKAYRKRRKLSAAANSISAGNPGLPLLKGREIPSRRVVLAAETVVVVVPLSLSLSVQQQPGD